MNEKITFRKTQTGNNNAEFRKLGTLVYNITLSGTKQATYVLRKLRRVRVTTVTVEMQSVLHIPSVCLHP